MYGVIKLNIAGRGRDKAVTRSRKSSSANNSNASSDGGTSPDSTSTTHTTNSTAPSSSPDRDAKFAVRAPRKTTTGVSSTPIPAAAGSKRTITFIDYSATIADPSPADHVVEKRRKDVRVHAAMASADKRKATIARKDAYGWQRRARLLNAMQLYGSDMILAAAQDELGTEAGASDMVSTYYSGLAAGDPRTAHDRSLVACDLLGEAVANLPANRPWSTGPVIERSSLPGKAIRTTLWDAVTLSPTLFQAAIFMAGTHSNTCGLPPNAIHDLGSGLILLRGASLVAIQAAVVSREVDSVTPIAIAMLAGWERRFGDQQSYEVHMKAWKSLSLPSQALDEDNVVNLADLTLETFREGLDERTVASEAKSTPSPKRIKLDPNLSPSPISFFSTCPLPPGFHIFSPTRPETRSLLRLLSAFHTESPHSPSYIPLMRRTGLENIAWNPCHSVSVRALAHLEESWQPAAELSALYHARAAAIPCGALLLHHAHDLQGSPWPLALDLGAALAVHTVSCQHLRTDALLDTVYAELAVWARFVLCAVSRDPDRDDDLRRFVRRVGWKSWGDVRVVMMRYLWMDGLIEGRLRALWDILMRGRTRSKLGDV